MAILKGVPLKDIIQQLGNKSYPYIECRIKYINLNGKEEDDFFGACSYDNVTNQLKPLDGDTYSLDDLYMEWKEMETTLIVWEYGSWTM